MVEGPKFQETLILRQFHFPCMKDWMCRACGAVFTPSPPSYSCPRCGSGNTIPKDYTPPAAPDRVKVEREPERLCPGCGSPMRCGYVVEANAPIALTTLGEGVYWSPGEMGWIGARVPLKAYACPGCGKIELYVRGLQRHRAAIESARYVCE